MRRYKPQIPTLEKIREALLSLGQELNEVDALGVFGSLARDKGFTKRSDIDVFVVVKEKKSDTDMYWYQKISKALAKFDRYVTVLVYPIKSLEEISNWYVLRLASEGIVLFDQGGIKELFRKIVQAALDAGLVEEQRGDFKIWRIKDIKLGQVVEVKVRAE